MSKLLAPEFRTTGSFADIIAELKSITRGQVKTVQRRQYAGLTLLTAAALCLLPTPTPRPAMLSLAKLHIIDRAPVSITRVCKCGQSFLLFNNTAHVLCLSSRVSVQAQARKEVARA